MSWITILLFLIYTWGLGFSITFFIKNSNNLFERNLMRIGIGLGVISFLSVLLNFLHIPIDWRIFLFVSLVIPVFVFLKGLKNGLKMSGIKLSKSNLYVLIVLVIFVLTLFMYAKGAFVYPYFEDDDPWAHAVGIKYVSIEKQLNDPQSSFSYISPYPPAYDALMGILHQTSSSIMWTMKFFNALIISLGIIFFYFFTKNFMHSSNKALIATVILAMVPSYLSHFIWAHSLVMTLLIVALYCLVKIDEDKRWIYPTILVIAGICLTQPTQPIKFFFIFVIYFIVKSIYSKKFMIREFSAIVGGYLLSFIWWLTNWKKMFMQGSAQGGAESVALTQGFIQRLIGTIQKAFPYDGGTATRAYTFNDFFIAKSQNMINNPIGIGVVICLLALFSLVLILVSYKSMKKDKKIWIVTASIWLLFTFLGVNSMTFRLPVGLVAFRFWMLFAIPLSIVAAEGFWFLAEFFKQIKIPKIVTIVLLVGLIFLTSGQQKYTVNTAMWGSGQMWTSMDEIGGYVWLKSLPVDTKVFAYSSDEQVIGFDKFSCHWCDEVVDFRKEILYKNASEVYDFLKRQRYEYLIIDGMAYKRLPAIFGENKTNELLPERMNEIGSFEKFQVAHQTNGMIVFKVL